MKRFKSLVFAIAFAMVFGMSATPAQAASEKPWDLQVQSLPDSVGCDNHGHRLYCLYTPIDVEAVPGSTAPYTLKSPKGTVTGYAYFIEKGGATLVQIPFADYYSNLGSYYLTLDVNIPQYLGEPAKWVHREYEFRYTQTPTVAAPKTFTRSVSASSTVTSTATVSQTAKATKTYKATAKKKWKGKTYKASAKRKGTAKATAKATIKVTRTESRTSVATGYSTSEAEASARQSATRSAEASARESSMASATESATAKAAQAAKKKAASKAESKAKKSAKASAKKLVAKKVAKAKKRARR